MNHFLPVKINIVSLFSPRSFPSGSNFNKIPLRPQFLVSNTAEEAGKLIMNLPQLWAGANLEERRKLLLTMLDAVYFEKKKPRSIVAVRPKPPFRPIFQVAASKANAEIRIINEPLDVLPKGSPVFLVETGERACLKMGKLV